MTNSCRQPLVPYGGLDRLSVYQASLYNGRPKCSTLNLRKWQQKSEWEYTGTPDRGRIAILGTGFSTLINNRSATSSDLVIGNRCTSLKIHLKPGRISLCDYLLMITVINIYSLQIPVQLRFYYRKANWNTFKNRHRNSRIPDLNGNSTGHIDNENDSWHQDVRYLC